MTTLAELLRPGLRAVCVGINPSPVSVAAGHYYQGKLGKRFWRRLEQAGVVGPLRDGCEDEEALVDGIGFADLVRYPTANARAIGMSELREAARDLERRLAATGCRRVLFVFRKAWHAAGPYLEARGYQVHRMPSPFAAKAEVVEELAKLKEALGAPGPRAHEGAES